MATKVFKFRFVAPQVNPDGTRKRSAMAAIDIAQMQDLPDTIEFTSEQVGEQFVGKYSRLNRDGNPYISNDHKVVCYFRAEGSQVLEVAL